jgi:hypothetical protein
MSSLTLPFALILLSVLVLNSLTVVAHNITLILQQYSDFGQFNDLLTQTKLAAEINRRRTITILALTNGRVGSLSGLPIDVQKRILSNHVVLDYYDVMKLNKLKDTRTVLTTLYQATGTADEQQGFLNVIHKKDGTIVFGSAVKGAPIDAQFEGSVASQPYNISVLSISHPIIAPGIDGSLPTTAPPPPSNATAPSPAEVPAPAESPEEVVADAPTAEAPEPSEAPADAPADDTSDAPTADAPAADNDAADANSAASRHVVSSVSMGLIIALVFVLATQ